MTAQSGFADESLNLAARLIPTLPFLAMALCGLVGCFRSLRVTRLPAWLTVAAVGGAFLCSLKVWGGLSDAGGAVVVKYFDWIHAGSFRADFSFYLDSLTVLMLLVVTGIGTLITIYAAGYMQGDEGYFRFFAYIGLFIFAMACLVMADNLVLLYLGWEGVGAASYLLIGFYYRKPSAVAAAKKAFIVNRIGDFGFALGIMATFVVFGTVQYTEFLPAAMAGIGQVPADQLGAGASAALENAREYGIGTTGQLFLLSAIPFLLMLGAFGKSAQFPLHVWLPDAMEGPTPVSALIHAATMVTAGVYMIARLIGLFQVNTDALVVVAVVGGFTSIFAATIALGQYDIKRIWAYSTLSQLGYMFLGVGVLGTFGAVFHLFTHAFFKALLFLTAGSVMHAMAGQLDLRKMSGLRHKMPVTCWLMFIGCLGLAGFFPLSGFFSKDQILTDAWLWSPVLGGLGLVTAALTAFYTFRLWFRVFWGEEKYEMGREHHGYEMSPAVHAAHEHDAHAHAHHGHDAHAHGGDDHHAHHEPHEMPFLMNAPLVLLAVGAIAAGALGAWMSGMVGASTAGVSEAVRAAYTGHGDHYAHHAHQVHGMMMLISLCVPPLMIALAWYFHLHRRDLTVQIASSCSGVVNLLNRKYYIDEIYDLTIRLPLKAKAWVFYQIDRLLIDGLVVNVLGGGLPRLAGWLGGRFQSGGSLQGYAVVMGLGVVVLVLLALWVALK